MAVVSELENQPAQAGTTVPPKRIPSYMRPDKTSSQKTEDVKPRSKVLKPKDTNQVQRVVSGSVPKGMKSTLGTRNKATVVIKGKGKDKKDIKAGALALVHMTTEKGSQKKTLGKLFTDGGLEEMLIKVLCYLSTEDLPRCLKVCKNTNAVMVKTSAIQHQLRQILYGFENLPIPARYRPIVAKATSGTGTITSAEALRTVIDTQSRIELSTIVVDSKDKSRFHSQTLEDCQGGIRLWTQPGSWTVHAACGTISSAARWSDDSVLAFCSEDMVLAEATNQGSPGVRIKFAFAGTGTIQPDSVNHPAAAFEWLQIILPGLGSDYAEDPFRFCLGAGGMAVILKTESWCLGVGCRYKSDAAMTNHRLVVFNWQLGTGLGVIKVHDGKVRIFDVAFLDDCHIICSTLRFFGDEMYLCIEVYEIPQNVPTAPQSTLRAESMPILRRVASLRFPSLAVDHSRPFCISACMSKQFTAVSSFEISVPHVSPDSAGHDQVIGFRLQGSSNGETESLQGVILVSRLLDIIRETLGDEDQGLAAGAVTGSRELPPPERRKPARIVWTEWSDWSSAVSLYESESRITTVPKSQDARVLYLARSRIDKTRAVLIIRDYNQRMLLAPQGHLTRNLGCAADQTHGATNTVADTFRPVTELKGIKSVLFGGFVNYGLGHRIRYIDLGVFQPNTTSSKIYWDENAFFIDPKVSQTTTARN